MSSSSQIYIRSDTGPAELILRNHQQRVVARGYGELLKKGLSPGLYTLEIRAGHYRNERIIALHPQQEYRDENLNVPFPSAAPVEGTSTMHEFHAYPVSDLANNPIDSFGSGGRLMIFVRNVVEPFDSPIDISELELLDSRVKPLCNLGNEMKREEIYGWAGWCADIEPGGYCLRSRQDERFVSFAEESHVEQSLWVSPGWTTFVFIPNQPGSAAPATGYASVHMSPTWMFYEPYMEEFSRVQRATEMALMGLRAGRAMISNADLDTLLHGKFQDPMLGILSAHILLQEPKFRLSLFNTVMRNLKNLIPDHPDWMALYVLRKMRKDDDSKSRLPVIPWPPMLSIGYRGVIERDATEPGLIELNTVCDHAAARLNIGSVWSRWNALSMDAQFDTDLISVEKIRSKRIPVLDDSLQAIRDKLTSISPVATEELLDSFPDVSDEAIRVMDYVSIYPQEDKLHRFSQDNLSVQNVSKQVGLPVASVKRAILSLKDKLL